MNPQDTLHYTPVNSQRFLVSERLSEPQPHLQMTPSEDVFEQIYPDTDECDFQKTSSAVEFARQNPRDIPAPKLMPTPCTRWCLRLQQELSEGTPSNGVYLILNGDIQVTRVTGAGAFVVLNQSERTQSPNSQYQVL